jgi:hypothetical protein
MYDDLVISYGYDSFNIDSYVNLDHDYHYDYLYEYIKKQYLMKDIDSFVIYNLTKITGNKSFSTVLVLSHNKKDEFCIPIEIINELVAFKNEKAKSQFIDRLTSLYKIKTIWDKTNDDIYFNFEGFNKYFLNLETNDLLNSDVKEMICNFYYSITSELINSYKTLYNNI